MAMKSAGAPPKDSGQLSLFDGEEVKKQQKKNQIILI